MKVTKRNQIVIVTTPDVAQECVGRSRLSHIDPQAAGEWMVREIGRPFAMAGQECVYVYVEPIDTTADEVAAALRGESRPAEADASVARERRERVQRVFAVERRRAEQERAERERELKWLERQLGAALDALCPQSLASLARRVLSPVDFARFRQDRCPREVWRLACLRELARDRPIRNPRSAIQNPQ